MKYQIVLCVLALFAMRTHAFEKQKITFENEANSSKKVEFQFDGKVFDPPLDLFSKKEVKQPEARKIYDFFKRFYDVNKNGTKQDVLALWAPNERPQLEKDITEEMFANNRARFNAVTAMRVKMVIEYGNYYICYIGMEFPGHKVVMKYPLLISDKELFLSNKLNGDYFYDTISHFLDRENYIDNSGRPIK